MPRLLAATLPLWLALALAGCRSGEDASQRIYDLSRDPTPAAIAEIRGYLDAEAPKERAAAMFKLVDLGVPDSLDLALAGLEDPDGFVRATAATLLGELRADQAVEILARHLLEDPDPVVRQRAAESLAEIGGDAATSALVRALEDPLGNVRLAAVRGVTELDPGRGFDSLLQLLAEDPDWEVRAQAAAGLGRAGNPAAAPALRTALGDRNEFVRAAAQNALRQLGDPDPS